MIGYLEPTARADAWFAPVFFEALPAFADAEQKKLLYLAWPPVDPLQREPVQEH